MISNRVRVTHDSQVRVPVHTKLEFGTSLVSFQSQRHNLIPFDEKNAKYGGQKLSSPDAKSFNYKIKAVEKGLTEYDQV